MGAYTSAILLDSESQLGFVDSSPWPYPATIVAGGLLAGIVGLALGFPALRLSGPYLAIATLALIISMPAMIRKYEELTGGSQGLFIDQPEAPFGLEDQINRDEWLYLVCLGITVLMLLVAWSVLRGPLGRAFVAVRESETAAAAMGINVARTKVTAFTISAVYAGVAGAVLTLLLGVMTPESVDITTSINFLTAIVIGGLASILGSIIGGILLILLPSEGPELIARLPFISEETVNKAPGAILGLLVIFVVLLMPYGVSGAWHRARAMTLRGIVQGVRALPEGLKSRVTEMYENIHWWWEDLPWRREAMGNGSGEKP
jgi:branched-chain amino acid transport system permease protein